MSQYKRTINYKGIDFAMSFDMEPEEKEVMYYGDGSGYPGSPARINYIHIEHAGVDFDEFLEDEMIKIEEAIWKSFED
jgi:hypothetical protein